jgi:Photoprotection regulator fluorescence recovery protein
VKWKRWRIAARVACNARTDARDAVTEAEKKLSRRVFEVALQAELAEVLQDFKARAAAAQTPGDMWPIEQFLNQRRQELDAKYDYRYSQLIAVFGRLIREGRLTKAHLEDPTHRVALRTPELGCRRRDRLQVRRRRFHPRTNHRYLVTHQRWQEITVADTTQRRREDRHRGGASCVLAVIASAAHCETG